MTDRSVMCYGGAMELLDTSLGTIAYDEQGAGSDETIVLLASGAHDHHDFDELRRLLPDRLRTIALDWPSHGESPPAAGPVSAMGLADAAEDAVAHLAPEGAIVLGSSVGGFAATRLAIRRPELVHGLVVADGGGFAGRSPLVRAFCAVMGRPRLLRAIYPRFATSYMRPRTAADTRARDAAVATTRRDPGLRAVSELWRSFDSPEHDLRSQAPSIVAPTLLLWGRRDPVIPLRVGRRAAELIPHARLVVFDSGHVPYTTDPGGVARELTGFIDTVLAERRARAGAPTP
jgi:pimeloyl-ACP methyl ester carboxylesterase